MEIVLLQLSLFSSISNVKTPYARLEKSKAIFHNYWINWTELLEKWFCKRFPYLYYLGHIRPL